MDERQTHFTELYKRALASVEANDIPKAEQRFTEAAAYAPEKWCDIATRLAKEGEDAMALDHFRLALTITKHSGIRSGIFNNIAILYAKRGQMNEALQMLDKAREENPQSVDAVCNLGQVRKWQGDLSSSNRYVQNALAMNPWHNEAQFLKALNALDAGDYANGFKLYECRWRNKATGFRKLECDKPEWAGPGHTFHGKELRRIFIYCEQGAGDIILMLRYAEKLREYGMWQSWAVKPGMAKLIAPLVDEAREDGNAPLDFDCHLPSASLPKVFGTTIDTVPCSKYHYIPISQLLSVDAAMSFDPLQFNVGIAWRGNRGQANDSIRSTNLNDWLPVLNVEGCAFHCMQVDGADEALAYPKIQMHEAPKDWRQTAARLWNLDLLITVDTGIMHLAGAMGVPTLCALHCRPYFVFPQSLDHTPWYSSVKLFKQKKEHQWKGVFENIARELYLRIQDNTTKAL